MESCHGAIFWPWPEKTEPRKSGFFFKEDIISAPLLTAVKAGYESQIFQNPSSAEGYYLLQKIAISLHKLYKSWHHFTQDESGDEEGKEASEESEYATDDDYEDESDWGAVQTFQWQILRWNP